MAVIYTAIICFMIQAPGDRNWQQKLAAETGSRNWEQKLGAETGSRNWQLISPHLPLFLFIFR
jgi:hypothetical protein